MSLPQMSVSGGVLILVVLALRALTIHKLPKTTFLALWWVALLRLLVPVSIPSVFSAYSFLAKRFHTVPQIVENPVLNFLPAAPMPPIQAGPAPVPVPAEPVPLSGWSVLWFAGAVICAIFLMAAYFRCRYEFQTSLPIHDDFIETWLAGHRLRRTITVRQSDQISSPLTYGLFHPVILLPKQMDRTDREQLSYVLLHEFIHIRRFDIATKFLLLLTLCLHWFNPLAWALVRLFNRDLELACDEQVVRAFRRDARAEYATLLIHMEETRGGLAPLFNHFSQNAMEERVTAIMKTKRKSLLAILAAVLLIAAVALFFGTSAKRQPATIPLGTATVGDPTETPKPEQSDAFLTFSVEGTEEKVSAQWVRGTNFSLCLPVGEWELVEENTWVSTGNDQVTLWVEDYGTEPMKEIKERLTALNYTLTETENQPITFEKVTKDNALVGGMLHRYAEGTWAVFYSYPNTSEYVEGWGSRLPVIADTFAPDGVALPFLAYLVIDGDTLHYDPVEYTLSDGVWTGINALQHIETITNAEAEDLTLTLTPETVYIFSDKNMDFRPEGERTGLYSTTDMEQFLQYLGPYNAATLSNQTLPFLIRERDGKVISIQEVILPTSQNEKNALADQFAVAYFRGDKEALTALLTEDYDGDIDLWTGDPEIRWELPNLYGDGDTVASVPFLEEDSYTYLTMGLTETPAGWRVAWYGLEK